MAEIPVEHKEKSSFPWWLIPLILLLLLLPLLYFCSRNTAVIDNTNGNANRSGINANNRSSMANGSNTAVVVNHNDSGNGGSMTGANNGSSSTTSATGGAITDVDYFGGASDQTTLVGRSVDFNSATVNRVVSDRVFTVKSGKGEMFVMLDDALNAGDKEKQIQIKNGQNLKLGGEFRNVPTGEVKDEAQNRDLNTKNYAQMKNQKVYLHATSVSDVK